MRLDIRVPGSTSNLGPGFDCLGLALGIELRARLERPSADPGVRFRGTQPPADNLLVRAVAHAGGLPADASLTIESDIPLARGLGSSGAAIVCGLLAARLARGEATPVRSDVLDDAFAIEGHPDNLGASVYGGLVASAVEGARVRAMPLELATDWSFVVVIPDRGVATADARRLLPMQVSRADAVFNLQRLGFLLGALAGGDAERLRFGLRDRLHQELRLGLVPGLAAAHAALDREPGCAGCVLSGSGPTLLGFVAGETAPPSGESAVDALAQAGVRARVLRLRPAPGASWHPVEGSA